MCGVVIRQNVCGRGVGALLSDSEAYGGIVTSEEICGEIWTRSMALLSGGCCGTYKIEQERCNPCVAIK